MHKHVTLLTPSQNTIRKARMVACNTLLQISQCYQSQIAQISSWFKSRHATKVL